MLTSPAEPEVCYEQLFISRALTTRHTTRHTTMHIVCLFRRPFGTRKYGLEQDYSATQSVGLTPRPFLFFSSFLAIAQSVFDNPTRGTAALLITTTHGISWSLVIARGKTEMVVALRDHRRTGGGQFRAKREQFLSKQIPKTFSRTVFKSRS